MYEIYNNNMARWVSILFILFGTAALVCKIHYLNVVAYCGVPVVNRNVKLNYTSTLDGSALILACETAMFNKTTNEQFLNVICHSNGRWIPDPAEFTCLSSTTVLPGIVWLYHWILCHYYGHIN